MLPDSLILDDVTRALVEDVGTGDLTAELIPVDLMVSALIISREPMLVCGQRWVDKTFKSLDPEIKMHWLVNEGEWLERPQTLCQLQGLARGIMTAERTALNFLQTLSGTATQTHQIVQRLQGKHTRLLDTRKTIPGLRMAQKYAVACGGGTNHRMGLYDAYLIKENHIAACGSITAAILRAKQQLDGHFIEVEVETLAEFQEALLAKPSRIMLDNFTLPMILEAVALNQSSACELEVSGGIDLKDIERVAATGVDFVSVGAITKSLRAIDLSLLIKDRS
ncbi:MAG: carboxylating nicotinate-nucleotide diphosphorylase [Legionellales bacterium]|nr:carboxylating nicotinate-nucleotide diphosphorylase [Legionellales bacterium]